MLLLSLLTAVVVQRGSIRCSDGICHVRLAHPTCTSSSCQPPALCYAIHSLVVMATPSLLSGATATAISGSTSRRTTCPASSQQPSRRSACFRIGLGLAAVLLPPQRDVARAADEPEPANNGWWLTEFPLPVPKIQNKEINNAETGTRSFLKKGIFMADIGPSFVAHAYRLRSNAFDLLALEDLLGKDASNYVHKYLRLKSTFMYYDFDKLITAAADDKQPYIDLANRLFDSFESLQQAVTAKEDSKITERYADTKVILQELMTKMA